MVDAARAVAALVATGEWGITAACRAVASRLELAPFDRSVRSVRAAYYNLLKPRP